MIDAAEGDLARARTSVENWFNAAMDHVTEIYRQRMQWVTLVVALLITCVLGVDTFALADSLWREPSLRAAVQGAAQVPSAAASPQSTSLQEALTALLRFNLPLGWGTLPAGTDIVGWMKKFVGLWLTTFAVSLGAPFWYNLLKQLSNLRRPNESK
jgi:hypothetical protein